MNTEYTDMFENGQKEWIIENDSSDSKAFQIDIVKHELQEMNIFTKCSYNTSSRETDLVDYKHAIDSYQERNEEKLDPKNSSPADLNNSKISDNENVIDIFYEDIKRETNDEKSSQSFGFCQLCYQNFDINTDIFKSTSYRFECSCQNICGEDMTGDVKRACLELTTVSSSQLLELQYEILYGDEVTKEKGSSALLSVPSMENNDKMESKYCSKLLENNPVENQKNDMVEKKMQCKCCSKFSTCRTLKIHEKNHTGKQSFCCKICSEAFSTLYELKVHARIHNGEKQFHCKICSKSFREKRSLTNHEKVHTGEKPFHCKICSKSFNQRGTLTRHERVHTGEKQFHCKICTKSFSRRDNLTVHERIHTGGKPVRCKYAKKKSIKGMISKFTREVTLVKNHITAESVQNLLVKGVV